MHKSLKVLSRIAEAERHPHELTQSKNVMTIVFCELSAWELFVSPR